METVKYTQEPTFRCLEDLSGISSDLSLVHFGQEQCKPYHIFSGTRNEYIIHFIISGHGFYSAGGSAWTLSAGQMFLIRPGESVIYCADSSDPWSYCWIGFRGFLSDIILKNCGFSKKTLIQSTPSSAEISDIFNSLFKHITLNYHDELFRDSLLLHLLGTLAFHHAEFSKAHETPKTVRIKNTYVNMAIEYINEAYMKGITVADISEHIGISRAHLNHVFQEELHLSVQSYLINYRMYKAAALLTRTNTAIKEIAFKIGYQDPLIFSKAFKKCFGISPREYRQNSIACGDALEIRAQRS